MEQLGAVMMYHSKTLKRVYNCTMYLAILRFVLTAKNVNNSASFRRICLGVFSEWETEKGEMLGNISFYLNIHWC